MKEKKMLIIICLFLVTIVSGCTTQNVETGDTVDQETALNKYEGKKILYIDSYHEGYAWSDGITRGVKTKLENTGAELKIHRMDTKNNPSEEFKKAAAIEAKKVIEDFNPDVVIISDDNGFKYLVQEYYKNAELPFVYCGLNWDSSLYDAPYSNTVGMIEVSLITQLIDRIREYAKGEKIGFLAGDTVTDRKTLEYYETLFNLKFDKIYFVKTIEEFKERYIALQDEVDMIVIETTAGIQGYSDDEPAQVEDLKNFVIENSKISSGTTYDFVAPYTLIGLTKIPDEQGEWSAETALKILDGTKPYELTETKNKKGNLFINMKLAEKMDIVFKPELLKNAVKIE